MQAATQEKAQQALRSHGIEVKLHDLMPTEDGPAKTPGIFFYVDFEKISAPFFIAYPADQAPKSRDPTMMELGPGDALQTATHGASMGAAKKIIADRRITEALNKTEGKRGVYCEGAHRRQNTTQYSTLNFSASDSDDLNLYSAYFELGVNRSVGTTTHKQWVQPVDSIIISGMYIHCLPVTKLYTTG